MLRLGLLVAWLGSVVLGAAAERHFNLDLAAVDQIPAGFRSLLTGEGKPGDWRVQLVEVAPAIPPLNPEAPVTSRKPVIAQLSRDITDERFPLLVFEGEAYRDFTFTTRFLVVAGAVEQMAGVAFRVQDEKNYYVFRASVRGGNVRFYKFVNGQRSPPVGTDLPIAKDVWHELSVECRGNEIRCRFDGGEAMPPLTDSSFTVGKLGFVTKSDSAVYFADGHVTYRPLEIQAQGLVTIALAEHPRLEGLELFARTNAAAPFQLVASADKRGLGRVGGKVEADVVEREIPYYGKESGKTTVVLPLHDQNGDPIAAVRVIMKSFPGQTKDVAVANAANIVRQMERRVRTLKELLE